LDLEAV